MSLFEDTNPKALKELLADAHSRTMALPAFQRDFVWEPGSTQELVVSIASNYPARSLLRVRDSVSWSKFLQKIRAVAAHKLNDGRVSEFFDRVLGRKLPQPLSAKAERDHIAMMSLYSSAPGQGTVTVEGTLWGGVKAVTYYADSVCARGVVERLDSAGFCAGNTLKERAWAKPQDLMEPKKSAA